MASGEPVAEWEKVYGENNYNQSKESVYEQTKYTLKQKINELFADDCSGYDYWHSLRALNTAAGYNSDDKTAFIQWI